MSCWEANSDPPESLDRRVFLAFSLPPPGRIVLDETSLTGLFPSGFAASFVLEMVNPHDNPAALKELQDAIYRDKVLRAREMSVEERLDEVFELSNRQMGMMLAGAMHRLGTSDQAEGWEEVSRWLARLDRVRDHGLYVTEKRQSA